MPFKPHFYLLATTGQFQQKQYFVEKPKGLAKLKLTMVTYTPLQGGSCSSICQDWLGQYGRQRRWAHLGIQIRLENI